MAAKELLASWWGGGELLAEGGPEGVGAGGGERSGRGGLKRLRLTQQSGVQFESVAGAVSRASGMMGLRKHADLSVHNPRVAVHLAATQHTCTLLVAHFGKGLANRGYLDHH